MTFDPITYSKFRQFERNRPKVKTPEILNIDHGQTGVLPGVEIEGSEYSTLYTENVREKRVFQIVELPNTNFSFPDYELEDNTDNFIPNLNDDAIFRMRVKDIAKDGNESRWSPIIEFATLEAYVVEPNITVQKFSGNIPENPILYGGEFETFGNDDTHAETHWKITRVSDDTVVWESSGSENLTEIQVPMGYLSDETEYKFEIRYYGNLLGWSSWGRYIGITDFYYVVEPSFTSHVDEQMGVSTSPTFITSTFETVPFGVDTHQSSDWQLADNSSFSNILFESLEDTENKTSWSVSGLQAQEYYVRVRYKGAAGYITDWTVIRFEVGKIEAPEITISGYPDEIGINPVVTLSDFVSDPAGDTHIKTELEVEDESETVIYNNVYE